MTYEVQIAADPAGEHPFIFRIETPYDPSIDVGMLRFDGEDGIVACFPFARVISVLRVANVRDVANAA